MRWMPLTITIVLAGFVTQEPAFSWDIPPSFPRPPVPSDNPMTVAKVELGRRLFYDGRLSVTRAQSCGSCHRQEFAFTDGAAQATGTTGEVHPRSSMSLANAAYNPALAWANPTLQSLEQQALVPMLGTNPVADPKRTTPVEGDLRLLVALVKGQPKAVLYRAVVPGTVNTHNHSFQSLLRGIGDDLPFLEWRDKALYRGIWRGIGLVAEQIEHLQRGAVLREWIFGTLSFYG